MMTFAVVTAIRVFLSLGFSAKRKAPEREPLAFPDLSALC